MMKYESLEDVIKEAKHNGVHLDASEWDDRIWLNLIKIPKKYQGQGLASITINALKDYARYVKKDIVLLVGPFYGKSLDELLGIYTHLGFKEFKDKYTKGHSGIYMKWDYHN